MNSMQLDWYLPQVFTKDRQIEHVISALESEPLRSQHPIQKLFIGDKVRHTYPHLDLKEFLVDHGYAMRSGTTYCMFK
jgi:hypothetical protein